MEQHYVQLAMIIVVAVVAIIIVAWFVGHRARQERADALGRLATSHGWQFTDEDDSYAERWEGKPFANRGKVHHVVTGRHRDRDFAAFAYSYTTTAYNGTTTTTTTHQFAVWTITLPVQVPDFSVGTEGLFGGKVAEAFGFERVNIDDDDFNSTFKVVSDDHQFGQRMLSPAVVDWLKRYGPRDWRLTGQTMIAYQKGALEAEMLIPRLDWMCELLDQLPADLRLSH